MQYMIIQKHNLVIAWEDLVKFVQEKYDIKIPGVVKDNITFSFNQENGRIDIVWSENIKTNKTTGGTLSELV